MNKNKFPTGWDEARVRRVLAHYARQSATEAVAEDEAAYEQLATSMVEVPIELVPKVRKLIAAHRSKKNASA